MRDRRATFFDLQDLEPWAGVERERLDREVRHQLGDAASQDQEIFALRLLSGPALSVEAQASLEISLRTQLGRRFREVVWIDSPYSPEPLWNLARRYQLDLQRSGLLGGCDRLAGLCRMAGVRRFHPSRGSRASAPPQRTWSEA